MMIRLAAILAALSTAAAAQTAPWRTGYGPDVAPAPIARSASFEFWPGARYDPAVPTLKSVIGHEAGERITRPEDAVRYLGALRRAAPARMRLYEYARSWENRPLVYAVIGSEAAIARLDAIKRDIARVADPSTALGDALSADTVLKGTTLFSSATRVLVDAMRRTGVRRLVCVTGFGAGDSRDHLPALYRLAFAASLRRIYDDKDIQEQIVRASGLDWTIVRPGLLRDGRATGLHQVLVEPATWKIGPVRRADVALYLADEVVAGRAIGKTPAIITQNIDDLHERAGSTGVVHLHGLIARNKCYAACQGEPTLIDVTTLAWDAANAPPRCPHCGAFVRPDVVWFGELLPPQALRTAKDVIHNTDLMLVVGTSGVVSPAAEMPYVAKEHGAKIVEINPFRSEITALADVWVEAPSGEALPRIVQAARQKAVAR